MKVELIADCAELKVTWSVSRTRNKVKNKCLEDRGSVEDILTNQPINKKIKSHNNLKALIDIILHISLTFSMLVHNVQYFSGKTRQYLIIFID